MAQISDDCFAFGGALMTMEEALATLAGRLTPMTEIETVTLDAARGRVLASPLTAIMNVPPHDNVAVDGYAFRHADLAPSGDSAFRVVARAAAGHPADKPVGSGEAARVFTGAVLPAGTDTVAMQEDCRTDGERVFVPEGLKRGANRRKAGEDIEQGKIVLPAGRRLRAQDIGLAASIGVAELPVYRRLSVAVFSTGDEIVDPGRPLAPGKVYDSNRHMLIALLRGLGFVVRDLGILPDRRDVMIDALRDAAEADDALVTSGGMSTGDEDHVRAAVEALGSLHFWRLAIRPGRPVALGQVLGKAFVGLPGNPVAAMVTFLRFARPMLLRLAGATEVEPIHFRVRSAFDYRKKAGRREFLRARIVPGDDMPTAHKFARDGAGILTSLVESDGLVELPEGLTHVAVGTPVDFIPFSEVVG